MQPLLVYLEPTVSLLLALFACSPSSPPPAEVDADAARFADAADDELDAVAHAAIGLGPLEAWLLAYQVDADATEGILDDDSPHCPTVELVGDTRLVYTAEGCVGPSSGLRHEGTLVLDNVPSTLWVVAEYVTGYSPDPDAPMELAFSDWSTEGDGEVIRIDGGFTQSNHGLEGDYTGEVDVSLTLPGLPTFRHGGGWACTAGEPACDATSETWGEVDGLGTFTVDSDELALVDGAFAGRVTVRGQDELVLDVDSLDARGCMDAWVGDEVHTACVDVLAAGDDDGSPDDEEEEEPEEVIGAFGYGGGDGMLFMDATTSTSVATLYADIANTTLANDETHPLTGAASGDSLAWTAALPQGEYVSGVSTAIDLDEHIESTVMRLRAYDADGALLACAFHGWVADEDAVRAWFDDGACE